MVWSGDLRKTVADSTERRRGRPLTQENEHNTLMCFPLEPVFTRDKRRLPNFMDEPTAGLDPKERIRIRNLISDLSQDRIVLIATHVVSDMHNNAVRKIAGT